MEQLDPVLREKLLKGEHVARHSPGIWNGIWTDMLIETTFMRFGKSRGGIKGITLQPNTVKKWALSLHVCGQLSKDVQDMIDGEESKKVHTFHKEESAARIKCDEEDRKKIRQKLQTCMNPLVIEDHPDGIVSIHSGRIGNTKVNVDDAVCLGEKQRQKFEESLPKGFYVPLKKEVVTLSNNKKHMLVQQTSVYNTETIYARALQLMTRNAEICSLPTLFGYELSPVPSALFDEFGDMNPASQKSQLMSQLRVQVSSRGKYVNALIIDASALLWHVHWPKVGTIQTYIDNVIAVIMKHVAEQNTFLVFDRYFEYSPKSTTRSKRGVNSTSMQLRADTPLPSRNSILTHSRNKVQLTTMICTQLLQHNEFLPHKLVVTGTDTIPIELQTPGVVIPRPDLETHHEEADVIIVQQAICLSRCATNNIKILSDNTDVFVLLVHFYRKLNLKCSMWMESVDKVKLSDIAATVHNLGIQADSLLAVHCLTGCDTTSQFFGIGKSKAVQVLRSGIKVTHLGCLESSIQQCIAQCTNFIAHCYGYKKEVHNMSDVRYKVWLSKKIPPKLKNLPPTTEAFELHIKRCHLQACTWNAAASSFPPPLNPTDYGWAKIETTHSLVPIQLPSNTELAPLELLKSLRCSCSSEKPCSTARCSCVHVGMSCKEFCVCEGGQLCGNLKTHEAEFDESDSEMSISESE